MEQENQPKNDKPDKPKPDKPDSISNIGNVGNIGNVDTAGGLSPSANLRAYPYLQRAQWPQELRKMPQAELPALAEDMRRFLIDSLSRQPGHFASSMGTVELSIALHYVFNTPYDRIVWDVGHQAYGHKLLTGRAPRFDTNRKLGGLSGFPNPAESEYDTFTAGHASNSISAALGMAVAAQLHHDEPRRNVVAVIGDASISGGLAFEGLNNAANTPNNLLIILNDNDMSIDPNVGALHTQLAKVTTSPRYNRLRNKTYQFLRRIGVLNEHSRRFILRFNNSLKSLLTRQQNIFEGLDIRYFGPIDGHDLPTLIRTLGDIKDMTGPRLLHIKTVKGKGYAPAEADPATWHAPGRFDPATGEREKPKGGPKPPKFQDVFGQTLLEIARENPEVVGVTAAMPSGTSMKTVQDALPDRVFDVGISEGHAVTFAGGLARDGMLPFVAIYSSFLQRGYDHIIHDVAIQGLPVTLCIDRAGLVGDDGVTHHGAFDIAYLRPIPDMVIAAPSDEQTLRNMLYTASRRDLRPSGPMAIRYPRGGGEKALWISPLQPVEIGRGRVVVPEAADSRAVVLSVGPIASEVRKALDLAEKEGVKAAHFDMLFVKPLDEELMHRAARTGLPIVTVEDGTVTGGFGTAVTDWLVSNGYHNEVRKVGIPDRFVAQGTVAELRAQCGMDAEGILREIRE